MKMKIGDISTYIKRGITPKYVVENGYAVVNQKCIRDGKVTYEFIKYTDSHKKYNEEKKVKQGDILINSTGTGTLGRVAYVDKDAFYTYVDSHVTILRCENYNSKFLYYWLSSLEKYIESLGKGSTNQIELNKDAIEEIEIPKLDFEQQNIVVENLSTYDDLIENNERQIKLLEEAAQRLYKEWFVDLHFPGYEDVEIVDGVPEGWNKELIGNVIGKVSRTKQIKTADYLLEGSIPIIDQSRDFIAGYTNDSEALVNTGTPVIVFGDHTRILKYIQFPFAKGADGTQLIISDRTNMPQSLLYLSLIAVDLSNYHYARHFKYLKAESILIPSQDVADEFDRLISPFFSQIQKLREKCYKLSQARDRLLPRLMSGEIEV